MEVGMREQERFLGIEEAHKLYFPGGVPSLSSFRRWASQHRFPVVKMGGRRLLKESQFLAWLDKQTIAAR